MYTIKERQERERCDKLIGQIRAGTAPPVLAPFCDKYACRMFRLQAKQDKIEIAALRRCLFDLREQSKETGNII